MKPLVLHLTACPDADLARELARIRTPSPDPVVAARRQALADCIERARAAQIKRGAR